MTPTHSDENPNQETEPRGPAGGKRSAAPAWAVGASLTLLCLIWGSTWLVIAEGLEDLPPFTSVSVRFLLAGAVFALVAPFLHRREGGRRPGLALVVTQGLLNFALPYGVLYWCEQSLPSGLVSVLWAVYPTLLAVLTPWILPDERAGGRQWLGLGIGFLGVAILFRTDLDALGPGAWGTALLLMVSPISAAVGSLCIKARGSNCSSVLLNRDGMLLGGVILAAVAWGTESDSPVHWTPRALGSVAYLAVLGTVVTFGLYFWLLRSTRANGLALIAYVTPGIALLLGATLGGEELHLSTLLGLGGILAGVAVARRGLGQGPKGHPGRVESKG